MMLLADGCAASSAITAAVGVFLCRGVSFCLALAVYGQPMLIAPPLASDAPAFGGGPVVFVIELVAHGSHPMSSATLATRHAAAVNRSSITAAPP
jgi:hypothetical protein